MESAVSIRNKLTASVKPSMICPSRKDDQIAWFVVLVVLIVMMNTFSWLEHPPDLLGSHFAMFKHAPVATFLLEHARTVCDLLVPILLLGHLARVLEPLPTHKPPAQESNPADEVWNLFWSQTAPYVVLLSTPDGVRTRIPEGT